MFENFPYSNFHDLNTDWIIKKIRDINRAEQASAESANASAQSATAAAQSAENAHASELNAQASAQQAQESEEYVTGAKNQLDLLQARVDNIIPSGTQTEGNTELLDIRVMNNGKTADSAGNAVRLESATSKKIQASFYVRLEEGQDLNALTAYGEYRSFNTTITGSILNKPSEYNAPFIITVSQINNAQHLHQELTYQDYPYIKFTRVSTNSGDTWTSWMLEKATFPTFSSMRSLINNYGIIKYSLWKNTAFNYSQTLPDGYYLDGHGYTVTVDSSQTYKLTLGKDIVIRNTVFEGSLEAVTDDLSNPLFEMNADSGNIVFENCTFRNLSCGIYVHDTGTPVDKNLTLIGCRFESCNCGLNIAQNGEYNIIADSHFIKCYYGIINRGGNNKIGNCNIDKNTIGILIDDTAGTNQGHGNISNCTLNHSDDGNGYGMIIRGTGRMLINNCNFYYSKLLIENTNGNVINGCGFGQDGQIEINTSGTQCNIINACMFRIVTGSLNIVSNGNTRMSNCWTRDGHEMTIS